jgi:hypothetical protein
MVLNNRLEHVSLVIVYTIEEHGLIQLEVMAGIIRNPDSFHA